jgi:hypothetical protein
VTSRDEHGAELFENSTLRRIFGIKKDEITGGWTKLHNEELQNVLFTKYDKNVQVIK